ncbi:MAG: dTMP kinase [Candidatus Thermoplasmatota archaeon]
MKRFVTFEGIDGSGKSTIAQHVYRKLSEQGYPVVLTVEPTTSDLGVFVKHCITTHADPFVTAFAFIADRINHCRDIQRWLDEQKIVLCDRYAESTYAYQGVQLEPHLKKPIVWLKELSKNRILTPARTYYLDIDPELALRRIQTRPERIPFEQYDFLKKVQKNYQKICRGNRFSILDATEPIDALTEKCVSDILK